MITDITVVSQKMLENWVKNQDGRFLHLLQNQAEEDDKKFVSHRWLIESTPKRMIYDIMYEDLLSCDENKSVLDIGSGYCSLSKLLASRHQYEPVDLQENGTDWYNFVIAKQYDLVIANDLFPNVDQRLELFLGKFLPHCKEMRLSLTYFNKPKWYTLKRADGDEVLTMLAWTGDQVRDVLQEYHNCTIMPSTFWDVPSIFPNGRQVAIVCLKGKL